MDIRLTIRGMLAALAVALQLAPSSAQAQGTYTVWASYSDFGTSSPGGVVDPIGIQNVAPGSILAFTITWNTFYVAEVMGSALYPRCGGSLVNNTFTTTPITASCAVNVRYKAVVMVSHYDDRSRHGVIDPLEHQYVVPGSILTFTLTPDPGHTTQVMGNPLLALCGGSLVGNTYTTTPITKPCAVNVRFNVNEYTVSAVAGPGGNIWPGAPQTVNHGETTHFTVAPDVNHSIASVTGCPGSLVGNTYYAGPVTGHCTVTATFKFDPPRLGNIASRTQVGTGEDVMIGGFVVGGSGPKRVAIVATGPSLSGFNISNPLADPTLTLVRASDGATIASNDDWQSAANHADLVATGLAPSSSLEAAILIDLAPGAYSAIVQGVGGGTGVAVIGVYEVDHPEIPLLNISARGKVLGGNGVMIGGFVIQGAGPQTVAIVATGPSLAQHGVNNPLADTRITLVRSSDEQVIASNDDWETDGLQALLAAKGLAPAGSLESGLYRTLPPGAYTVVVQGASGSTGVAVIGIYRVAPP